MGNREDKKKPNWVGIAVVLLLTVPQLVVPIGIFAGIVFLVIRSAKTQQKGVRPAKTGRSGNQSVFDDCPDPLFCFHKDKGQHHVRRGREIDPWDRPDIDIRKYQRKE